MVLARCSNNPWPDEIPQISVQILEHSYRPIWRVFGLSYEVNFGMGNLPALVAVRCSLTSASLSYGQSSHSNVRTAMAFSIMMQFLVSGG